ncbi:MAG TPA: TrkH family potassium uptake protein [Candidatus Poseidoniaceae archaeon]|nr:TrkH family potassium uptake protein [Candidatus Poseidoniaceae archaeon]
MRRDVLFLILGWTLIAFTLPLVICGIITVIIDGFQIGFWAFGPAALISLGLGTSLVFFLTRTDSSDRLRDVEAFVGVGLVWPISVLIGALPFWLGGVFIGPFTSGAEISEMMTGFVHSWFESMSGFTTTGATVIHASSSPMCDTTTVDCINAQHRGLLIWRSLTQWFGGMGIIMLGMMLLSRVLGGGMALARAELTGPSLSRLKPKLRQTATALWGLYLSLTVLEFLLLFFVGQMGWFDALNHALTTLPTGGFSTHDASIGFYDSVRIEAIITIFMFLAGVNFTLLWFCRKGNISLLWKDEEFRYYAFYIIIALVLISITLVNTDHHWGDSIRDGLFQVVSIATSTGYASANYMDWPVVTHVVFFILMIIGASAGSTGGGLKLLRVSLAFKIAMRELRRIAQPRKIDRIRMNDEVVEDRQLGLIVGMLFVWVILFGGSSILLAIMMPDASFESIVSLVASSLGNTGPALDAYGPANTWVGMNNSGLILTSILMWFGRLELLTAVIVLHPHTWRREEKSEGEVQGLAVVKRILNEKDEADSK